MLKSLLALSISAVFIGCSQEDFEIENPLNDNRFSVNGLEIYDNSYDMKWVQNDLTATYYSTAYKYCENRSMRLPNIYELKSIMDMENDPTVRAEFSKVKQTPYWSDSISGNDAWIVQFDNGTYYTKNRYEKANFLCIKD